MVKQLLICMVCIAALVGLSDLALGSENKTCEDCNNTPALPSISINPEINSRYTGIINHVPVELEFYFKPEGQLFARGFSTPTQVSGQGYVTFLFEPTERADLIQVSLKRVHWWFAPFIIPSDIDMDREFESLEVKGLNVTSSFFNLEESRGILNLSNGDFKFDWVYRITPEMHPLLRNFNGTVMEWTKHDYGYMNLTTGHFEIHCGVSEIMEGPLAGALIRGGGGGEISTTPSTLNLNVEIVTPGSATACESLSQKTVLICPGDRIRLCWSTSRDIDYVILKDPASGDLKLPSDYVFETIPPYEGIAQHVYVVTGYDGSGNPVVQQQVDVKIHSNGGKIGPIIAHSDGHFKWIAEINPRSISARIQVRDITLLKQCIDWKRYDLEHISSSGVDYHDNLNSFGPIPVPTPFFAAGKWEFIPAGEHSPDPFDYNELCFEISGDCVR